MFTFSKEEAVYAAKQFCHALELWTDSFVGPSQALPELERNADGAFLFDEKTDQNLHGSRFVQNIIVIFDFALTGIWDGQSIFEDRDALEDELVSPLTELSAFDEIFSRGSVNFHDESGNDLMDITVAGENIIEILSDVISMAFSRFALITDGVIELEKMAMLADVSLKTVRNAVSSKGQNRIVLSNTTINGKPCVDADEAMRWLESKKGYSGPFFVNELPAFKTYYSLGQLQYHCMSLMKSAGLDWEALKNNASLDGEKIEAFQQLVKLVIDERLAQITPVSLKAFGVACQVDDLELFVKEASKIAASALAEYQANRLFKP